MKKIATSFCSYGTSGASRIQSMSTGVSPSLQARLRLKATSVFFVRKSSMSHHVHWNTMRSSDSGGIQDRSAECSHGWF